MQASDVPRAVAAALSSASALGLTADDVIVLQDEAMAALRRFGDVLPQAGRVRHRARARSGERALSGR